MRNLSAATALAIAALAAALCLAGTAAASPHIRYGVQDDAYLAEGPSAAARVATLDRLGVKLVRYTLDWRKVARHKPRRAINPKDAAYDWSRPDAVLEQLHKHGISVLVTLWGTPAWANGGQGANVAPRSKYSLAAFAYAAAKRYPWVHMWEVWNEPNLRRFLKPNLPEIYVHRLLNPTYAVLHAIRFTNRVAGGATSPRRTPSGLSPLVFMRGMRSAHARFDAYSHHPYPVTRGERPTGFAPGVCRYCKGLFTLANLSALIREVKRDFGPTRIWLTEYGFQTDPAERAGVSARTQAQYVSQAALRAKAGRYVDLFIHFMVKDEPRGSGWQSGFLTARGALKPAFYAFMLPIAQVSRVGLRTTIWGQVRPGTGPQQYKLQRYAGGRWASVGGFKLTTPNGSYLRLVRAGRGARFRVFASAERAVSPVIAIR